MTQAIALPAQPSTAAAATQTGGTAVVGHEGFAAALAELCGLAAPAQTQPASRLHAHGAKIQAGSRLLPGASDSPADPAFLVSQQPGIATVQTLALTTDASKASVILKALVSSNTPAGQKTINGQAGQTAALPTPVAQTNAPATAQPPHATQVAELLAPSPSTNGSVQEAKQTYSAKCAAKSPRGKQTQSAAATDGESQGASDQVANQKTSGLQLATAIQRALGALSGTGDGTQSSKADAMSSQTPAIATATPLAITVPRPLESAAATQTPAPQTAVPLDALAVHIARKFESGESRFEIRLDPIELGKLDISLTVGDDGYVQAVVRAERPETLDMLQRDARLLEQQLRQSGLNVDSNSLNFSLGGGNAQRQASTDGNHGFAQALGITPETEPIKTAAAIVSMRDGVDIRI